MRLVNSRLKSRIMFACKMNTLTPWRPFPEGAVQRRTLASLPRTWGEAGIESVSGLQWLFPLQGFADQRGLGSGGARLEWLLRVIIHEHIRNS